MIDGSSLVVYPAAYMPLYAKQSGAELVDHQYDPHTDGPDRGRRHPRRRGGGHGRILQEVKQRLSGCV